MLKKLLCCITFLGFTHIVSGAQRPTCPPAPKKAPPQEFLNVNNSNRNAKRSLADIIEQIAIMELRENQNNTGLNIQRNNNQN